MPIDFQSETKELINNLNGIAGYLDCEKILLHNIRKHIANGVDDTIIIDFLKQARDDFDGMIKDNQSKSDCTNFRFASGFIDVFLKIPNWKAWIRTINL
jgi:hypothetical protein